MCVSSLQAAVTPLVTPRKCFSLFSEVSRSMLWGRGRFSTVGGLEQTKSLLLEHGVLENVFPARAESCLRHPAGYTRPDLSSAWCGLS